MPTSRTEAFSRVLIDKALEFSGWNLLNPHEVRFEVSMDGRRADCIWRGSPPLPAAANSVAHPFAP